MGFFRQEYWSGGAIAFTEGTSQAEEEAFITGERPRWCSCEGEVLQPADGSPAPPPASRAAWEEPDLPV